MKIICAILLLLQAVTTGLLFNEKKKVELTEKKIEQTEQWYEEVVQFQIEEILSSRKTR